MANPVELPGDPYLRPIARELEAADIMAEVMDGDWRIVYVTSEYIRGAGLEPDKVPGTVGLELFSAECQEQRRSWRFPVTSPEELVEWFARYGGALVTDVGLDRVKAVALPEIAAAVASADPDFDWVLSQGLFSYRVAGHDVMISAQIARLRDPEGRVRAVVTTVGPHVPGFVLALLALGSIEHFERVSRLLVPSEQPGAVLFADLEASTRLTRELAPSEFFELVRAFAVEADEAIVRHAGVVGKHAGDGATAFFLASECGSASAAALAAVAAVREMAIPLDAIAAAAGLPPGSVQLNAGLHWSDRMYVGDLITSGRLEATGFGEEVNVAARVQQTASRGQVLASKALLEHLAPDDVAALGIAPDDHPYALLGDLPAADAKARTDAGTLAVRQI